MEENEIEFFVHGPGAKPKIITASADEVLRNVLIRAGFFTKEETDIHVFIGECEDARREPENIENGADEHASADAGLSLKAYDLKRHRHVHVHRCRLVAIEVNFGGKTKRRKFSPAATVGVVTDWGRRKFRIDPAVAAEFVLQLCSSTDQPRPDVHVGELVTAPNCSLCFDLVKEITPQG